MEDVNRKREKRKGRLKSIVKLTHLKGYPEEDVRKALRLVSSFIRASKEVVKVIRIYNLKPLPHKWLNLRIFEALKL